MDALEQQMFALELIISCRLALDPPEVRRQLAEVLGQAPDYADTVELAIRQRAVDIVLSSENPSEI